MVRAPDDNEEGKGPKRCGVGAKRRKGKAPQDDARTAQRHCAKGSEGSVGKSKKANTKLIPVISFQ